MRTVAMKRWAWGCAVAGVLVCAVAPAAHTQTRFSRALPAPEGVELGTFEAEAGQAYAVVIGASNLPKPPPKWGFDVRVVFDCEGGSMSIDGAKRRYVRRRTGVDAQGQFVDTMLGTFTPESSGACTVRLGAGRVEVRHPIVMELVVRDARAWSRMHGAVAAEAPLVTPEEAAAQAAARERERERAKPPPSRRARDPERHRSGRAARPVTAVRAVEEPEPDGWWDWRLFGVEVVAEVVISLIVVAIIGLGQWAVRAVLRRRRRR